MSVEFDSFFSQDARRDVLAALEERFALLLTGPRGCGKTSLARWGAQSLGRPCEVFHLGGTTDVEALLFGVTTLRDGETRFVPSDFLEAVSTPGAIIVLDEINRVGGAKAQSILLSCLDPDGRLQIPIRDDAKQRTVDVAPDVGWILTANIGSEYHGTDPLDCAFLDRVLKHRLDYSEAESERLVREGLSKDRAADVMKRAKAIRELHTSGAITDSISTRGLVRVARLLIRGYSMRDAFEANVAAFDDESLTALRTALEFS